MLFLFNLVNFGVVFSCLFVVVGYLFGLGEFFLGGW